MLAGVIEKDSLALVVAVMSHPSVTAPCLLPPFSGASLPCRGESQSQPARTLFQFHPPGDRCDQLGDPR